MALSNSASRSSQSRETMRACSGITCYACGDYIKTIFFVVLSVLMLYGVFYVDALTNYQKAKTYYVGQADKMERSINVVGEGKVSGRNDVAMTTIGYYNVDKDVSVAQAANAKVMDQVMNDLKKMGIEEKDLTSDYSITPEYTYPANGGPELKGYRVSQNVSVKIRDLGKIPSVLALAGKYGANEVGGLNFTIDDRDNLKAQARTKALADARKRAEELAKSLGVRLGSVISFNEYGNPGYYDNVANYSPLSIDARGGMTAEAVAPAVSSGSQDVVMQVNVTYEILP